jgi:uncharacterized protein YccT (UPF0319 family)
MKTVLVIRNGEIKLRLPGCTIRSNGTIWTSKNKIPLCDAESAGMKREGKEKIAGLAKTGKAENIPLDCLAKYGKNESGLLVVDAHEYEAEQRAKREAALTPSQRERREIEKLYYKAERIANSDSEDNVWLPMKLRGEAEAMLKAWREKYPAEARKEKAANLRSKAAHQRHLAAGALVYDADGWLDDKEQQRRHDEFINEAAALEKQAAELESM